MTYRELAYIVNDAIKNVSNDSFLTIDHILFLAKRYRANLLYQKYIAQKIFTVLAENNEQEICLDLKLESGNGCQGNYLKSTVKIPQTLDISDLKITLENQFDGEIAWVSNRRFNYVGNNKFLQNIIYATKGNDKYLYLKSNNPQAYYLNKVKVTGVFEDPEEAAKYQCSDEDNENPENETCDILDKEFPIEDSLSSVLIQTLIKDLSSFVMSPEDTLNNASDDLGDLAYYIKRNIKSELQRKQQGNS